MGFLKSLQRRSAKGIWSKFMAAPEFPSELQEPLERVLLHRHVNPLLFIDNLSFLEQGGLASLLHNPFGEQRKLKISRSVGEFQRITERPQIYSLWFLAAFPDVASWLCRLTERAEVDDDAAAKETLEKFFDQLDADDPEGLRGPDGKCSVKYANAMVDLFIAKTGRQPECCL